MNKYPKYKPSGISWIGEIPEGWKEFRFSSICKEKTIRNKENEELLSVFLDRGVIRFSDVEKKRTNVTSTDLSKYQLVEVGDFVLNNQQAWRGSVGVSSLRGIVSPAYIILSVSKQLDTDFANYLFRSSPIVALYYCCSKSVGSIQRNLDWQELKSKSIFIPSLPEQKQIVKYLSKKISLIDTFVEKKKQEIELLKEHKQAFIAKAVTKGLNPKAKMKDSGISWIGEIPENWDVLKAKYMFVKNKRPKKDNDEVITCFRDGQVTLRKNRRITGFTESQDYAGYQGIRKGDLVIHQMDAFAGAIGVSDSDGMGTSVYHCCTPKGDYNVYYYAYLLRQMALTGWIQSLYKGIRERSSDFSFDVFAKQELPIPPKDEQKIIVDEINQKTKQIDLYVEKINKQIDALQEYKQSLIADVVTGKVNVQNIKID